MDYKKYGLAAGIFVAGVLCALAYTWSEDVPVGSVAVTNEYFATSTGATASLVGITGDATLRTGVGALGSVVITGANTGYFSLIDATTTDVTKRTGNKATSTITVATFPINAAAGTYTFDVAFKAGLMIELDNGIMPTTTVTFR